MEYDERDSREAEAIEYVREVKKFYLHLIQYIGVTLGLFILNIVTSPDKLWVLWVLFGWGFGVICHGLSVFKIINLFGPDWEKKQIERRLNRKL